MAKEPNDDLQGKSPNNYNETFKIAWIAYPAVVIIILLAAIEAHLWSL